VKRTKEINLHFMRKIGSPARPLFKPLALAIAALSLAACTAKEEVKVVASVDDCKSNTSLTVEQCEAAYAKAVAEAERTGPKYRARADCEAEFGYQRCQQSHRGGLFMPLMAGFMVGNLLNNNRGYSYNPVYQYRSGSSYSNNRLMTADGSVIGSPGKSSYSVNPSTLKSKPSVTRTVSRGGFGAKASAKSSWGGGKSKGWGG
jgi:uncharacterized protein YgiB involved in biofilm formation